MVQILFELAGTETSYRNLAGSIGVLADTLANYIRYSENAYLILICPFFSYSQKQRARRNNWYYPIDPAFRESIVTKTEKDLGKDFELIVFLALKRYCRNIYYWNGKGEVAFVLQNRQGLWPIHVSIDKPKERHLKALEEFYSNFNDVKPTTCINPDNSTTEIEKFDEYKSKTR